MKIIFIFLCSFLSLTAIAQKSKKSVYLAYNRHLPTKFVIDSGNSKLVGRKMNVSLQAGLIMDYPLANKLEFRTGLAVNTHWIYEPGYRTSGKIPDTIPTERTRYYGQYKSQLIEYIERFSVGIPLKIKYKYEEYKKWQLFVAGGPIVNFYFTNTSETIASYVLLNDGSGGLRGDLFTRFESNREFYQKPLINSMGISIPKIEWELESEAIRPLKNKAALLFGLRAHLGTRKLERSNYVIWPEFPDSRATGHYSINRSFFGMYMGYRFR